MKIFSIKDMKADSFNRPFCSATRGTAMREIGVGLANDPTMRNYSKDFALYELATFITATGRITTLEDPYHVCDITELLTEELGNK